LQLAWIRIIDQPEAQGLLSTIYRQAIHRAGKVFNILRIQSQNPPVLQAGIDLYLRVMHGESPLTRAQREMLAVVVSKVNDCYY
jgi:alkylhydroperoxidase family enzyme